MKYIVIICAIFAVLMFRSGEQAPAPIAPVSTEEKSKSVFVLFENGGSVPADEQAEAVQTALHLLQQLSDLGKRKATREVQINLITSALPNRIAWSGNAHQLLEQAQSVKDILSFKESFSDIGMAFDTIKTTIDIQRPGSVQLYTVGPFINVPFQNTDQPIDVQVPQAIKIDLALTQFIDRLSVLKFYRVHPDQIPELNRYLTANAVQSRVVKGEIDFSLLGAAQTRSNLNDLL